MNAEVRVPGMDELSPRPVSEPKNLKARRPSSNPSPSDGDLGQSRIRTPTVLVNPTNQSVFFSVASQPDADALSQQKDLMSELGLGGAFSATEKVKIEDPFSKEAETPTLSSKQVVYLFLYNAWMVLLLVFEMLEIPFRIAFSPPFSDSFFVVSALIDWIFVADFVVRFQLPYLHRHGHYVSGPKSKLRKNYVRTWCFPNLIAAVPWDFMWFCIYMSNPSLGQSIWWFKFCRLTRIFRLPEVFVRLQEWEVSLTFDVSPILYRATRIVIGVTLWITTAGCLYWLIADSEKLSWSWNVYDDSAYNPTTLPVWNQYLTTCYWSMVTFSTVGFGDIGGSTYGERGFIIFYALLSIGVTAYATGNVVTWLQSAEAKRTVLADKLDQVKAYIQYRKLNDEVATKLLRFHRFRGLNAVYEKLDSEVLDELPPTLRFKIARHFRSHIFKNWGLAQIVDTPFLTSLIMRMRRETRHPGEIIAQQGHTATKFFILTSGHAVVIKNGVEVLEMISYVGGSPAGIYGESALFNPKAIRSSTLRALASCELLYLKRKDLRYLLEKFPEAKARVDDYARSLVGEAQMVAEAVVDDLKKSKVFEHDVSFTPAMRRNAPNLATLEEECEEGEVKEEDVGAAATAATAVAPPTIRFETDKAKDEVVEARSSSSPPAPIKSSSTPPLTENSSPPVLAKGDALRSSGHGIQARSPRRVIIEADPVRVGDEAIVAVPVAAKTPSADGSPSTDSTARLQPRSPRVGAFPVLDVGGAARTANAPGSRFVVGGGGNRSPRGGNPKSPRGGKSPRFGAKTEQHLPKFTEDEIDSRIKELPRIPTRLFKLDILNDPSAVAKTLVGAFPHTTVVAGSDIVDFISNHFSIGRPDSRYIGQRLLRNKVFTSLEGSSDLTDDSTQFIILEPFLSKEKLVDLLDADVVGGVVTAKMKQMIENSGSGGKVKLGRQSGGREAKERTATVMTNFSLEEIKEKKTGRDDDESSEDDE